MSVVSLLGLHWGEVVAVLVGSAVDASICVKQRRLGRFALGSVGVGWCARSLG